MDSYKTLNQNLSGSTLDATQQWLIEHLPQLKTLITTQQEPLQLKAVHSLNDLEEWLGFIDAWPQYFGDCFITLTQCANGEPLKNCFEQAIEIKRQMQHALVDDAALQPLVNELVQCLSKAINQGLSQLQILAKTLNQLEDSQALELQIDGMDGQRFEDLAEAYLQQKMANRPAESKLEDSPAPFINFWFFTLFIALVILGTIWPVVWILLFFVGGTFVLYKLLIWFFRL